MIDLDRERVAFEKNQFTYGYEYINDGICEYGRYKIKRALSLDDSESEFVTSAWYVWLERAKQAHQETQALQEELIKTNAEKLHAQMVADAAIEELKSLKARLKDGVIVPREISEEMLYALNEGFEIDYGDWYFDAHKGYKAMIEAVEKEND